MRKNLFKVLVFSFILALVLGITPALFAQEAGQASNDPLEFGKNYQFSAGDQWMLVQPAICYITTVYYGIVYDPNSQTYSQTEYAYGPFGGTGFVVNPETGTIVTAGHMVDAREADEVNLKFAILDQYVFDTYPDDYYNLTQEDWNWIYENYKVVGYNIDKPEMEVWVQFNTATASVPDNPGNTFVRAEVMSMSTRNQRDIAILKITPVTGRALSSAIIGDSSTVSIGDQLTIIGYPWTSDIGQNNPLNPTITQGSVSGKVMLNGTEVLQVQGDARPGNSGGPVLSREDGKIIGILTMGTDETNNYLRPANDVKTFLGVENKLGQVDMEWMTGLAMYQENHFSEALKHFDAVLNLSQGHLLAQEYKAKAQANIGSDVPWGVTETTVAETPATTVAVETTSSPVTTSAGPVAETTGVEKQAMALGLTVIILAIVLPIIFVILIVVIVILVVRKKRATPVPPSQPSITPPPAPPQVTAGEPGAEAKSGKALEILKERYAKGEISKEEFDKMMKDLM